MPGGFPYAITEAHRNAHRATQGGRGIEILPDTQTPHREPQRAHRVTPEKRPRDPPGTASPPEWVSFRSLFVLFRWELGGANFAKLIFDLLKSPFCGFSENEKVYFLSRFSHRHQVEVHQPPQNQDNAAAPLPGLLLRRGGCSA